MEGFGLDCPKGSGSSSGARSLGAPSLSPNELVDAVQGILVGLEIREVSGPWYTGDVRELLHNCRRHGARWAHGCISEISEHLRESGESARSEMRNCTRG